MRHIVSEEGNLEIERMLGCYGDLVAVLYYRLVNNRIGTGDLLFTSLQTYLRNLAS